MARSATRPTACTQLYPPDHRTCSLIAYAISTPRGAYSPVSMMALKSIQTHRSLHCPTRYPLTSGSRDCTCGQSVLPRSTTSQHSLSQGAIEPAICCLLVVHAATEPRHPTLGINCALTTTTSTTITNNTGSSSSSSSSSYGKSVKLKFAVVKFTAVKVRNIPQKGNVLSDLRKAFWSVEDLTGAVRAFHRTGAQVANVCMTPEWSISSVPTIWATPNWCIRGFSRLTIPLCDPPTRGFHLTFNQTSKVVCKDG